MSSGEYYPDKAREVNKLLETLADPHRRELILYFESRSQTETDSLEAVVSHIDDRMPSTGQAEIETALHHTHLPKLMDRGWVDYDQRQDTIRYQGHEDAEQRLTELLAVFDE
jgi:hypothetical protein